MFVRQIKSRKSTCFQIGQKQFGRFMLVKHIGCATTPAEIEALRIKAKTELGEIVLKNQLSLFPEVKLPLKAKLLAWHITGFHQVFGTVYDRIGFPRGLLRDLVIARIVYPKSKSATIRYLKRYLGINLSKDTVYRFQDTLSKDELTGIAFTFVSQKDKGVSLFFYDVTTLYFETENEDDFRKKGFSKNHRSDMPQILIGLFVDSEGYPFDFDFFEGNTFEGHTFQSAIGNIIRKYAFAEMTVVADAAMLSEKNLSYLQSRGISYIVGARLKNLPDETKNTVFRYDFAGNSILVITSGQQKLIVDYSEDRAKKDEKTRERLIRKLETRLERKEQVVRKSKYILWEKQGKVAGIDKRQIEEDKKYDGLKGYITDKENKSTAQEIIKQYHNLWKVEKAFRMSKNDLKERPIYHQSVTRIKSHLIICFVSLLVMKETEKILSRKHYSLEKTIEILGKVGQGEIRIGKIRLEIDSELDEEVQLILKLFTGH